MEWKELLPGSSFSHLMTLGTWDIYKWPSLFIPEQYFRGKYSEWHVPLHCGAVLKGGGTSFVVCYIPVEQY